MRTQNMIGFYDATQVTAISPENVKKLYEVIKEKSSYKITGDITKDFEQYFGHYHFVVEITNNGEYGADFGFNNDWPFPHHNELVFLTTIAPFVNHGIYLEMSDSDGCRWRWIFVSGLLVTEYPTFVWKSLESMTTELYNKGLIKLTIPDR